MKEKEQKTEEVVMSEYGIAYDQSREYRAERSFFLQTTNGPLTAISPGSLVRLSDRLGNELFHAGKVVPIGISEIFEVVRPFRIAQAGEWVDLQKGDVVKLDKEEAILYLRQGMVKEKRGGSVE